MKAEETIHVIFVANVLLLLNISKFTLKMDRVAEKMVVKHFCYNLIRKLLHKINISKYLGIAKICQISLKLLCILLYTLVETKFQT